MPLPAALLSALPYILPALGGALGFFTGGGGGQNLQDFFLGSDSMQQLPTMDQDQLSALSQILGSGMQDLSNPYQGFEPIKQNALQSFQQDIVPMLTERFAGSGSNALSSPQLQTNLSSAGSNLAQRLAGMQSEYGMQNKRNALAQLQLGLQPRFSYQRTGGPGALQSFAASPALNTLVKGYMKGGF